MAFIAHALVRERLELISADLATESNLTLARKLLLSNGCQKTNKQRQKDITMKDKNPDPTVGTHGNR